MVTDYFHVVPWYVDTHKYISYRDVVEQPMISVSVSAMLQ